MSEWIKCSDRLPEIPEGFLSWPYLVFWQNPKTLRFGVFIGKYQRKLNKRDYKKLNTQDPYNLCLYKSKEGRWRITTRPGGYVTHWMELPEYPQEPLKWQRSSGQ